jgi:uncharacterized RDD family membrane protein YckC
MARWLLVSSHQPAIWFLWFAHGEGVVAGLLFLTGLASLTWRAVALTSALFDAQGQGVHDRLAGSRVVGLPTRRGERVTGIEPA